MKIGLLYTTTDNPWGGINTFFRNFEKAALQSDKIELVDDFSEADIILTSGHYSGPGQMLSKCALRNYSLNRHPLNPMGFLPKRGVAKIVFRLDGLRIFYRHVRSRADDLLLENLKIADAVVFQSEHCKNIFDSMKADRPKLETTILNGANVANFHSANHVRGRASVTDISNIQNEITLISNSWSRDTSKGFATIAEFSKLNGVKVSHIGRWSSTIDPAAVTLLGEKREKEIGDILRTSHFLLFPSENDACPNIVAEALASGIPVLYHNSGGTPELCGNGKYGMSLPDNSASHAKGETTFAEFIKSAKHNYCEIRNNVASNIETFTFKRCFNEYINFFKSII